MKVFFGHIIKTLTSVTIAERILLILKTVENVFHKSLLEMTKQFLIP